MIIEKTEFSDLSGLGRINNGYLQVYRGADPYEELANAIIIQAAKDYRRALIRIKREPNDAYAKSKIKDCEHFFISIYYEKLTRLDGKYLMNKIRKEVESYEIRKLV